MKTIAPVASAALLAVLAIAPSGQAQPTDSFLPQRAPERTITLSAAVGAEKIGDDYFAGVHANLSIHYDRLRLLENAPRLGGEVAGPMDLQLGAPFRLRFVDRGRDDDVFRGTDWDEIGDLLSVVRRFEYGRRNDAVYWRLGEQADATLGHGTVLTNQINNIDPDHGRFGAFVGVHAVRGGVEMYVDSITEPATLAARAYIRPWGAEIARPALSRLGFGVSLAVDPSAPVELAEDSVAGQPVNLDATRSIVVERDTSTAMLGFDFEAPVVRGDKTRLTLFSDVNLLLSEGTGVHVGMLSSYRLSDAVVVEVDAEYRLLGKQYLAEYFGWTYRASRMALQRRALDAIDESIGHGARLRLAMLLDEVGSLEMGWSADFRDQAPGDTLYARILSDERARLQVGVTWALVRREGLTDANWWSDAWIQAEAKFSVLPWMAVNAYLGRRYLAEAGERYGTADEIFVGVEFFRRWTRQQQQR